MITRDTPKWLLCVMFGAPLLVILAAVYVLNPSLADQTRNMFAHKEKPKGPFNPDKAFFQADVPYLDPPIFKNITKLAEYPPHNYRGPGHEVFATFFATRESTPHDPYFLAAQQLVYRLLWQQRSKSEKHPVVVFVAPFVTKEQRQYFAAAGALVRELGLREFTPELAGVPARLQDMFSKFEMWRQTDFSRIAYLDTDAFPFNNIDKLFKLAKERKCKSKKLPLEDKKYITSICSYVFAAYFEEIIASINAGVMIIKPNVAMHRRLVREMGSKEKDWDTGYLEQALLNKLFSKKGPFPPTLLGHEWNAGTDVANAGKEYHIIHTKIWADFWAEDQWPLHDFNDTGHEMNRLYASDEFEKMRRADLSWAMEDSGNAPKQSAPAGA